MTYTQEAVPPPDEGAPSAARHYRPVARPPDDEEAISYPSRRREAAGASMAGWARRKGHVWARAESLVTLAVVGSCVVFVFLQFDPSFLFLNTTITGGDTGAHVLLPWVAEHQLLPHLRLTGWTMSNWDGFPAVTFYFPLPIYSIVALNTIIPYNIAFKLVTAAPMILLPVAAWLLGRLARAPFPIPAVLAVATVPYLFGSEFSIYGGNIFSTLAGEFCFGWSLWFGLVFLGLVVRGLQTGRYRAWAAVIFACTFMSHIDPTMFVGAGAGVLLITYALRERDWRGAFWWAAPTILVGGFLAAWWALAFYLRFPYVTDMGYTKNTSYLSGLFPTSNPDDTWLFILAIAGAALSLARKRRLGEFLTIMAVLSAIAFRFMPNSILWNNRVLPFWFLCLYLLAGLALIELYYLLVERTSNYVVTLRAALLPGPILVMLVGLVWVGGPLGKLPGEKASPTGGSTFVGLQFKTSSQVPSWISWNYTGYQYTCSASDASCKSADIKTRWPEYEKIVKELEDAAKKYGCGSAMWEYNSSMNDYGTTDALTILPYWTNGCIGSMEGLYYESSATTPFHFINQSELSTAPSDPMVGLPYASSPDVGLGVKHLQMLGVKYYLAMDSALQQQAAADSSLKLISTFGPYDVNNNGSSGTATEHYWKLYLVKGSATVVPLANQPVVMRGLDNVKQSKYLQVMTTYTPPGSSTNLSCNGSPGWYLDPGAWDVYLASSGPSNWSRVNFCQDTGLPVIKEPKTTVSDVVQQNSSISFNVSRLGTPVEVKISYFPNWQVSGAEGVYRISPNMMVVVPTSHHVRLWYGYTAVDYTGYVLSFLALIGLVVLVRRPLAPVVAVRRPAMARRDTVFRPTSPAGRWLGAHFPPQDGRAPGNGNGYGYGNGWGPGQGPPAYVPAGPPGLGAPGEGAPPTAGPGPVPPPPTSEGTGSAATGATGSWWLPTPPPDEGTPGAEPGPGPEGAPDH